MAVQEGQSGQKPCGQEPSGFRRGSVSGVFLEVQTGQRCQRGGSGRCRTGGAQSSRRFGIAEFHGPAGGRQHEVEEGGAADQPRPPVPVRHRRKGISQLMYQAWMIGDVKKKARETTSGRKLGDAAGRNVSRRQHGSGASRNRAFSLRGRSRRRPPDAGKQLGAAP